MGVTLNQDDIDVLAQFVYEQIAASEARVADAIARGIAVGSNRPPFDMGSLEITYGTVVAVVGAQVYVALDSDQNNPVPMAATGAVAAGQRVAVLLTPPSGAIALGALANSGGNNAASVAYVTDAIAVAIAPLPEMETDIVDLETVKSNKPVPTSVKTSDYNAAAGDLVLCDTTSAGFNVTLPASPADKDFVEIIVVAGGNAATVQGNSKTVGDASTTSVSLTGIGQNARFVYSSTAGWWKMSRSPQAGTNTAIDPTTGAISATTTGLDLTSPQSMQNKFVQPRVGSVASSNSAFATPLSDLYDVVYQTNTEAANTSTAPMVVAAPTNGGTVPVEGQELILRMKCTNVQYLSWATGYRDTAAIKRPTVTTGAGVVDETKWKYNYVDSQTLGYDVWDLIGKTTPDLLQQHMPYIESGCTWAAVSAGNNRAANLAAGVVWINGARLVVNSPATADQVVSGNTTTATTTVIDGVNQDKYIVVCAGIAPSDQGKRVFGTGIPVYTFVGTVVSGTRFLLSSSPTSQVNVAATAIGTNVVLLLDNCTAARVDACTTTTSSSTIGDTSIVATDVGRAVTGTGIPNGSYVGTVTPGVSFVLSSTTVTSTTAVAITGAGGSPNLTLGGHTFPASTDAYNYIVDNGDGTAKSFFYYNPGGLNQASPALTTSVAATATVLNTILCAIIQAGASSIASGTLTDGSLGAINQGSTFSVLPLVSSIPYCVTDGGGTLIYPTDRAFKGIIGYRQRHLSNYSYANSSAETDVPDLNMVFVVPPGPAGRKVKLSFFNAGPSSSVTSNTNTIVGYLRDGSNNQGQQGVIVPGGANNQDEIGFSFTRVFAPGSYTWKGSVSQASAASTLTFPAGATYPFFISAELV